MRNTNDEPGLRHPILPARSHQTRARFLPLRPPLRHNSSRWLINSLTTMVGEGGTEPVWARIDRISLIISLFSLKSTSWQVARYSRYLVPCWGYARGDGKRGGDLMVCSAVNWYCNMSVRWKVMVGSLQLTSRIDSNSKQSLQNICG